MINGDKEDFNGDTKEHINISKRGLYHEIIRVVKDSGFKTRIFIFNFIFSFGTGQISSPITNWTSLINWFQKCSKWRGTLSYLYEMLF